jgi:hypothetical protein
MIYSITGWDLCENGAAKVTALFSAYTALALHKSTLVLQLTNPRKTTVENILVGKQLQINSIDALDYTYAEEGVDALLRNAKYGTLTEETIADAVTPLLHKEKLLDIAKPSRKADFELEMEEDMETVISCIQMLNKYYEMIYILLPEQNRNFCNTLYEALEDHNIKCVAQGIPARAAYNKNFTFVVSDYEPRSTYSAAYIKKQLGVKSLFYFTRNIAFNDAAIGGTVLEFVQKNFHDDKSDDNYYLFECLRQFFSHGKPASGDAKYEEEEQEAALRLILKCHVPVVLEAVDDQLNVEIEKKKRLFRSPLETLIVDRKENFSTTRLENAGDAMQDQETASKKRRPKKIRKQKKDNKE